MQWVNWEKFYKKITIKLRIDPDGDFEAAKTLQSYFHERLEQVQLQRMRLKELCRKPCVVFGAGPSLSSDLSECLQAELLSSCTTIAADGATSEFIRRNIIPHIIVTDLDGDMNHISAAARGGSILIIHGHGDNKERITEWVPLLLEFDPIPTTQVEPIPPLENFGGFSDGDRAAFMAVECGCTTLALAGFDLGEVVGRSSKPEISRDIIASPRKRIKLEIATELLQELRKKESLNEKMFFYTFTAKSAAYLEGYTPISPQEFVRFIHSSENGQ
ncbi:MAG: 6-hydroxymethylpterin diphosphokinase MptE-like protein [Candidatus Heimdallarchaeota archaeon]